MTRIPTHDLGISTGGWTRYQLHQTGLDFNIVLTPLGELVYMRSTRGDSGVPRIVPTFCTLLEIP